MSTPTVQVPGLVAGTWNIDPVHSEVGFSVRHLMVSKVKGSFKTFDGTITIAENPLDSKVEARIDASSVDTRDENRDNHLRSADFFEVESHPQITFVSTAVRPAGGSDYEVTGDLTIHGVTRSIDLGLEFNGVSPDPWGGTRAGFSAGTEIRPAPTSASSSTCHLTAEVSWSAKLSLSGGFVLSASHTTVAAAPGHHQNLAQSRDLSSATPKTLPTATAIHPSPEISATGFPSRATPSTHAKSIDRKVGVTPRSEAIECLRQLGVLRSLIPIGRRKVEPHRPGACCNPFCHLARTDAQTPWAPIIGRGKLMEDRRRFVPGRVRGVVLGVVVAAGLAACASTAATTKPASTNTTTTVPATAIPSTTTPAITTPDAATPANTTPATTTPATTTPASTKPAMPQQATTKPEPMKPAPIKPATTAPGTMKPPTTKPLNGGGVSY